jgi:hypothetical protein
MLASKTDITFTFTSDPESQLMQKSMLTTFIFRIGVREEQLQNGRLWISFWIFKSKHSEEWSDIDGGCI